MVHRRIASTGARLHRATPLLVLGLALVITGVAAFEAQRASRSHRETAEALLRDYGTFAAWSFSRHAADLLDTGIRASLLPLRRDLLEADPACLDAVLDAARSRSECGCGVPLGGRFAFQARLAPEPSEPVFAGDVPDPGFAEALMDALGRDLPGWESQRPFGMVQVASGGDGPVLVAYARLRDEASGAEAVYGVEVNPTRFDEELTRALDHPDLLPQSLTRGDPNTALVAIRVLGPGGRVLFASHEGSAPPIHADYALPERLAGATVRAAVIPEAAERLIIGGMPRDRTPGLLLLFAVAAGLMILAVSLLRKEAALARLRSDFVASVSHELRTPVAQIRLFAETIRLGRARTAAEHAWAFARIERESRRLGGLIDKILHFSRTDRGAVPVDRVTVDLRTEIADAAASFRELLRPGQARLDLDLDRAPSLPAHPDSLRQVLLNLLENAVKYGPHGQTIRLVAERREGRARITVDDEGPGVPAEEREAIFEPFRRGQAAVGSVKSGGGIGLAVVREVVRAHDGRAWVEDAPCGGARFVVDLPGARPTTDRTVPPDMDRTARPPEPAAGAA